MAAIAIGQELSPSICPFFSAFSKAMGEGVGMEELLGVIFFPTLNMAPGAFAPLTSPQVHHWYSSHWT